MIEQSEILEALTKVRVPIECIRAIDTEYSLPDDAYIKDLGKRYSSFLFNSGLHYEADKFDCDDYAVGCCFLAKIDHALHRPDLSERGIAFGFATLFTINYGHQVNISIQREQSGLLAVKLWEPQPNNGICLTPFDLSSVELWRLVYL